MPPCGPTARASAPHLVVTVAGALLLVLDVTVGALPALVLTGLAVATFAALWFGLPIRLRYGRAARPGDG